MAPHAAASTTTMRGTMNNTFSSSSCRERGRYHHQHNRRASKVVSRAQSDGGSSSSSPSLLAAVGRAVVPSLAAVALAVAPPASAAQLTTVRIAGSSNPNVFEAQKTLVQAWSIVRDTFVDRGAVGARWDGELADALQRTSAPSVDANGAYGEIGAMLKTLHDPYTRFVPADEFRNFRLKSEGEVDGVGLLIASEPRSGRVFVLSPIDGSPAARAGIMAGDEVVGIDGRPTRGLAGEEAAVRLRGRHGTAVTVKIARREPGLGALPLPPASPAPLQGQGLGSRWGGLLRARRAAFRPAEYRGSRPNVRLRQVRLVRDSIVLNPVKAELIQASLPTPPHPQPQHQGEGEGGVGGQGAGSSARVPLSVASRAPASGSVGSNSVTSDSKIGYLKLEAFNEKSAGALVDAAQEMKRAGATRFILDLRDNPGGLLNTSLDIASLWLQPRDVVLRTWGPSGEHETVTVAASSRPLFSRDDSLAVLVNENSASSAEILAGALHDNGRARLFGPSRTFGKGKIQSVFQLDDGSAVFVTVAKYQTPKGHNIDGAGVLPDKVCGQPLRMAGGSGSGGGEGEGLHGVSWGPGMLTADIQSDPCVLEAEMALQARSKQA